MLAERLKKKGESGKLYKSSTQNKSFFNIDEIFLINKREKLDEIYNYFSKTRDLFIMAKFYVKNCEKNLKIFLCVKNNFELA